MFRERCLDFDLLVLRQFWLAPEPPVRVAMLSLPSRKQFDRGRRGWVPDQSSSGREDKRIVAALGA